jgi:hypothetical protein
MHCVCNTFALPWALLLLSFRLLPLSTISLRRLELLSLHEFVAICNHAALMRTLACLSGYTNVTAYYRANGAHVYLL